MNNLFDSMKGARFYAIAFLVVFYYFFTKPTTRGSILMEKPKKDKGETSTAD